MSNNTKLKILCQRLAAQEFESIHTAELALEQFEKLTTPAAVLTLIADLDEARNGMAFSPALRLKKELERLTADNESLRNDESGFRQGADAEARAGDEARAEVRRLTAENRAFRRAVKFASETFGKITSSDGSGHADLGLAVLRIAGLPVTGRLAAATGSENAPCKIY